MTVEIQTPEGMKTGSSVVEYVRRPDLNLPGIAMMLVGFSTRQGTLLRAQHWTRGLATIIEIWPAGWVVIPRLLPYGAYKIQPEQLNARLPKITAPYSDGGAAMWVPPNGNISEGYYGVAGEFKELLEGFRITQITIEPTSDAVVTKVPTGSLAWLDDLRARNSVLIVNPKLKSNPHKNRYGIDISQIEKGWW